MDALYILKNHPCESYRSNYANTQSCISLFYLDVLLVCSQFIKWSSGYSNWGGTRKCLSLFLIIVVYVSLQILVNSVSSNPSAVLYEKVTVSEGGSPLLRDMLFSPDQQYIYTLTDRQVILLLEMHILRCTAIKAKHKQTSTISSLPSIYNVQYICIAVTTHGYRLTLPSSNYSVHFLLLNHR